MTWAYYNEFDPFAAQWLRNLSDAGHIARGVVDDRSITDVEASYDALRGATQAHFFAGIGVWSYALRLAGWPDDVPVWTGSCPCQPFSVAGRQKGTRDERHLWPEWRRLIAEFRPPVLFGEQVASPAGRAWLDTVSADLEALGYAVGSADLCAAGIGAPHIRQRLFFGALRLADGCFPRLEGHAGDERGWDESRRLVEAAARSVAEGGGADGLGYADGVGAGRDRRATAPAQVGHAGARDSTGRDDHAVDPSGSARGLEHADGERREELGVLIRERQPQSTMPQAGWADEAVRLADGPEFIDVVGVGDGPTGGFWARPRWLLGRDGGIRPTQPGTLPLAHGTPTRVGELRAYGNAIVAPLAAEFIQAFAEAVKE